MEQVLIFGAQAVGGWAFSLLLNRLLARWALRRRQRRTIRVVRLARA